MNPISQSTIKSIEDWLATIVRTELKRALDHHATVKSNNVMPQPTARISQARISLVGRKLPAKYRHPRTGETWAGRGMQPTWLKQELKKGRKLMDFLVK
jgi:DNA-binding protein H-NS